MISIICVYNNEKTLNTYLITSLKRQTSPFELITIDNTDGKYRTAPGVLNEFARRVDHDYLMFVHQDVALRSDTWLTDVEVRIKKLEHFGAAGSAGRGYDGSLPASVWHGNPPHPASPMQPSDPLPVQTLDGCLMIVPRAIFQEIPFDEETCTGWHLYVADYCLDLACCGYKVYVLPEEIYHESTGPADASVYMGTVQNLIRKHRKHTRVIRTTIGEWKTKRSWFPCGLQSLLNRFRK
jgi:GT2 family glycosyltransferase